MRNAKNLDYCADLTRERHRDRFLQGLFVPKEKREALMALYALDAELQHIHHKVSEEMIGHIRYAWWKEALEEISAGKPPRAHPVVEALAEVKENLPWNMLTSLVENYQEQFPKSPQDSDAWLDKVAASILSESGQGWHTAGAIIDRHRARFGADKNSRLYLKLLWAGAW